jgi:hypothetical protein
MTTPRSRRIRRPIMIAFVVIMLVVVLGVVHAIRKNRGHELHGTIAAGPSQITSWLTNAEPVAWAADDRIFVNRRGANGLWGAYSILPNGHDQICITCRRPAFAGVGAQTNRGASDLSPDGRYVLLVVERGSHPGNIGATETQPGKGVYNDIWLATANGSRAWRLTTIPTSHNDGIIWPRFDRTGTEIVWSQMHQAADLHHPLGQWALKTAALRWHAGVPHVAAVRTYDPQPGRFYEPYQFSPDDQRIIFASDIDVARGFLSPSAFNAQIWTINAAGLDDLQRVTPRNRLHGAFSDYNEFAFYLPGDSDRIVVARTFKSTTHGLDYWTMNLNGSDAQRLTFTNQSGAEHLGYTQTLGLAFDPHDPRRFVAGLSHDLSSQQLQAVFITIRGAHR